MKHSIKRLALVLTSAAFLMLGALPSTAEQGPTEPAFLYRAEVVNVVDGDTIDVDIDLGFYTWIKNQRIRLVGIDAPEPRGETREKGKESGTYLRKLIDGKSIIIRTVKGPDDADRDDSFGRWLGIIYLDGEDINQTMIDAGQAVKDVR